MHSLTLLFAIIIISRIWFVCKSARKASQPNTTGTNLFADIDIQLKIACVAVSFEGLLCGVECSIRFSTGDQRIRRSAQAQEGQKRYYACQSEREKPTDAPGARLKYNFFTLTRIMRQTALDIVTGSP
jgi:hypothetical protein